MAKNKNMGIDPEDQKKFNKALTDAYKRIFETATTNQIEEIIQQSQSGLLELSNKADKSLNFNDASIKNKFGAIEKTIDLINTELNKAGLENIKATEGRLKNINTSLSGRLPNLTKQGTAIVKAIGKYSASQITTDFNKNYNNFLTDIENGLAVSNSNYSEVIDNIATTIAQTDAATAKAYSIMAKNRVSPKNLEQYVKARNFSSATKNKYTGMSVEKNVNPVNLSQLNFNEANKREQYFSRNKNAKEWVKSQVTNGRYNQQFSQRFLQGISQANEAAGRQQFVLKNPQTGESYLMFGSENDVNSAIKSGNYSKLASVPIGRTKQGNLIKNGRVEADRTNYVVDKSLNGGRGVFLNAAESALYYVSKKLNNPDERGRLEGLDLQKAVASAVSAATRNSNTIYDIGDSSEDFYRNGSTLNINSLINSIFSSTSAGRNRELSIQERDYERAKVAQRVVEIAKKISRVNNTTEADKIIEEYVNSGFIPHSQNDKFYGLIGAPLSSLAGSQGEYKSGILSFASGNSEMTITGKQGSRHNIQGKKTRMQQQSLKDINGSGGFVPYYFTGSENNVRAGQSVYATNNADLLQKWNEWLASSEGVKWQNSAEGAQWLSNNGGLTNNIMGTLSGGGIMLSNELPQKFKVVDTVTKRLSQNDYQKYYREAVNKLMKNGKDVSNSQLVTKQMILDQGWASENDLINLSKFDSFIDDITNEQVIEFDRRYESSGIPKLIDELLGIRGQVTATLPMEFLKAKFNGAEILMGEEDVKTVDSAGFMFGRIANLFKRTVETNNGKIRDLNQKIKKQPKIHSQKQVKKSPEFQALQKQNKGNLTNLFNEVFKGTGLENILSVDDTTGSLKILDDENYSEAITRNGLLGQLKENLIGLSENSNFVSMVGAKDKDDFINILKHEYISQAVPYKDYETKKGVLLGDLEKISELRNLETNIITKKQRGQYTDEDEKLFDEERQEILNRYKIPKSEYDEWKRVNNAFSKQILSGSRKIQKKAGGESDISKVVDSMADITIGWGPGHTIDLSDNDVQTSLETSVDRNFNENSISKDDLNKIFYGKIREAIENKLTEREQELRSQNPNASEKEIRKELNDFENNLTVALDTGIHRNVNYNIDGRKLQSHGEIASVLPMFGSGIVKDISNGISAYKLPVLYDDFVQAIRAQVELKTTPNAGTGSDVYKSYVGKLNTYGNALNKLVNSGDSSAVINANKVRLDAEESSLDILTGIGQEMIDSLPDDSTLQQIVQNSAFVSTGKLAKRFKALDKESLQKYYDQFGGGKTTKANKQIDELVKTFTLGSGEFYGALQAGKFDNYQGFVTQIHRGPSINEEAVRLVNMFARNGIGDEYIQLSDALAALLRGDFDRDHINSWINKHNPNFKNRAMGVENTARQIDFFKEMVRTSSDDEFNPLDEKSISLVDSLSNDQLEQISDIAKLNRQLTGVFNSANVQFRNSLKAKGLNTGANDAYNLLGATVFESMEQELGISSKHTISQLKDAKEPEEKQKIINEYGQNVKKIADNILNFDSDYTMEKLFEDLKETGQLKDVNGTLGISNKAVTDAVSKVALTDEGKAVLDKLGISYDPEEIKKNKNAVITQEQFGNIFTHLKDIAGVSGILPAEGEYGTTLLNSAFAAINGKQSMTEHAVMGRIAEEFGKSAVTAGNFLDPTQRLNATTVDLTTILQSLISVLKGEVIPSANAFAKGMSQTEYFDYLNSLNEEYDASKEAKRISGTGERLLGVHYSDKKGFTSALNNYRDNNEVVIRDPNDPSNLLTFRQTNPKANGLKEREWKPVVNGVEGDKVIDEKLLGTLNRFGYSEEDFKTLTAGYGSTNKGTLWHSYSEAMDLTKKVNIDEALKELDVLATSGNQKASKIKDAIDKGTATYVSEMKDLGKTSDDINSYLAVGKKAVMAKMRGIWGNDWKYLDSDDFYSKNSGIMSATEGGIGYKTGNAMFPGQFDALQTDEFGRIKLIDWKTHSGYAKDEEILQLTKYAKTLQHLQQQMIKYGNFNVETGRFDKNFDLNTFNQNASYRIDEDTFNVLARSIVRTFANGPHPDMEKANGTAYDFKNLEDFSTYLHNNQWDALIAAGNEFGGKNIHLSSFLMKENIGDLKASALLSKVIEESGPITDDESKDIRNNWVDKRAIGPLEQYGSLLPAEKADNSAEEKQKRQEILDIYLQILATQSKINQLGAIGAENQKKVYEELKATKETEKSKLLEEVGLTEAEFKKTDEYQGTIGFREKKIEAEEADRKAKEEADAQKKEEAQKKAAEKEQYRKTEQYKKDYDKLVNDRARNLEQQYEYGVRMNMAYTEKERSAYEAQKENLIKEYENDSPSGNKKGIKSRIRDMFANEKGEIDPNDSRYVAFLNDVQDKQSGMQTKFMANMKGQSTLWDKFAGSMRGYMQYITGFGLAYKVIGKITQTISKVINLTKQLDASLTNIRIVTGASREEAERYVDSYIKLADQMGVTSTQIAQATTEWLRQGYSIREAESLVVSSIQLSKLGMMEASAATSSLTAVIKGFKLEASESAAIVDKLVSLDLDYATSAGQIATALSKVAAVASNANMNLDETSAILTVLMDVTQAEAGSVGTALQTILSRFGNVKAGAFLEISEEGEDASKAINDIEKVLTPLGIKLRSSTMEMRSFDTVMDELADKWMNLSDVEKNAIGTAFAGTRQRNYFTTLVTSWDEVQRAKEIALNSAGTADIKYDAYLDSVASATERITLAWERLTKKLEASKVLKVVSEGLAWIVDNLDKILTLLSTRVLAGFLNSGIRNIGSGGGFFNGLGRFGSGLVGLMTGRTLSGSGMWGGGKSSKTPTDTPSTESAGPTEHKDVGTQQENLGNTGAPVQENLGNTGAAINTETSSGSSMTALQYALGNNEKISQRVTRGIASGVLAGGLRAALTEEKYGGEKKTAGIASFIFNGFGAAFGPVGMALGALADMFLTSGIVELFQNWFHAEEIARDKRVEEAEKNLKQLQIMNESISTGLDLSKIGTDELNASEWQQWNESIKGLEDSLNVYDENGKIDSDKTAEYQAKFQKALAEMTDDSLKYDAALTQLTERTDGFEKVMSQWAAAQNLLAVESEYASKEIERYNINKALETETDEKLIKSYKNQLNAIQNELYEGQIKTAFYKSGTSNMNALDVAGTTLESVLYRWADTFGDEAFDSLGNIDDEFKRVAISIIRENDNLMALMSKGGNTRLGIYGGYQSSRISEIETAGGMSISKISEAALNKNQKEFEEIAKTLGITDEYLENFRNEVVTLGSINIDAFKNSLILTNEELISVSDNLWWVTSSDISNGVTGLRDKFKTMGDALAEISANGAMASDSLQTMLEKYPELLIRNGEFSQENLIPNIAEILGGGSGNWTISRLAITEGMTNQLGATILKELIKTNNFSSSEIDETGMTRLNQANSLSEVADLLTLDDTLLGYASEAITEVVAEMNLAAELEKTINQSQITRYEKEIANLQSLQNALDEAEDSRKDEIALIKARQKLENAQNEKKRVYRSGVGFTYVSDTEAISQAQEELENLEKERDKQNIQYQIDVLEQQKSILEDISKNEEAKNIENSANEILNTLNFLTGGSTRSLNDVLTNLNTFSEESMIKALQNEKLKTDFASNIEQSIKKALGLDEENEDSKDIVSNMTGEALEKVIASALNKKADMQTEDYLKNFLNEFDSLQQYENAIYNASKSNDLAKYNAAIDDYNKQAAKVRDAYSLIQGDENFERYKLNNKDNSSVILYDGISSDDLEEKEHLNYTGGNVKSATEEYGVGEEFSDVYFGTHGQGDVLRDLLNGKISYEKGELIRFGKIANNPFKYIGSSPEYEHIIQRAGGSKLYYGITSDGRIDTLDRKGNGLNFKKIGEWDNSQKHTNKGYTDVNGNTVYDLNKLDPSGVWYKNNLTKEKFYYYNGQAISEENYKKVFPNFNIPKFDSSIKFASGTKYFRGGSAYVNEEGLEGIITPNGTITSLPAKSGILPADLTRNLYALGEVAPNLIKHLESKNIFDSNSNSKTEDNSINIQNLNAEFVANEGFDFDQFLVQVRQVVDNTRHN